MSNNILGYLVSKLLAKLLCSFAESVADSVSEGAGEEYNKNTGSRKRRRRTRETDIYVHKKALSYWINHEARLRSIRGRVGGLPSGSRGTSGIELLRIRVQGLLHQISIFNDCSFWRPRECYNANVDRFVEIVVEKAPTFGTFLGLKSRDVYDLCYVLTLQEVQRLCDNPEKTVGQFDLVGRVYRDDGPLVAEREALYGDRSGLVRAGDFKSVEPYIQKFLNNYPWQVPWFKGKSFHYPLESLYLDFVASPFYRSWSDTWGSFSNVIRAYGAEKTRCTLTFLIRKKIKVMCGLDA